jgi:hypothetical protein
MRLVCTVALLTEQRFICAAGGVSSRQGLHQRSAVVGQKRDGGVWRSFTLAGRANLRAIFEQLRQGIVMHQAATDAQQYLAKTNTTTAATTKW